jgi:hypothetical protein
VVKYWTKDGQKLVKIGEFPGFWGFFEGKKGGKLRGILLTLREGEIIVILRSEAT